MGITLELPQSFKQEPPLKITGQKYAVILSYVGTGSCGWQTQKGASAPKSPANASIQEQIEAALLQMTGEKVSVVGSGRTDAGVHALGQVAHFVLRERIWEPRVLLNGMNALMASRIRARSVNAVPNEFHSQRSAFKKQYSYYFQQGPCAAPHLSKVSWWIRKTLDHKAMNRAAQALVGKQEFKVLQASGAKPGPTVREIFECEVTREPCGFPGGGGHDVALPYEMVRIRVLGSGFLKQMVRGIAGTLLQVGEGRRPDSCMAEILRTQERRSVGPTAPGRGLWLEKVWYKDFPT